MKEDFFKFGYSPYYNNSKKKNWTSRFLNKIIKHRVILFILFTISVGIIINFCLILKFMHILEVSSVIY